MKPAEKVVFKLECDYASLRAYTSLSDFGVDAEGSLGNLFYDVFREVVYILDSIIDKEDCIHSLFCESYAIARNVWHAERPSLHFDVYRRYFTRESDCSDKSFVTIYSDDMNSISLPRKDLVTPLVYQLIKYTLPSFPGDSKWEEVQVLLNKFEKNCQTNLFKDKVDLCKRYSLSQEDIAISVKIICSSDLESELKKNKQGYETNLKQKEYEEMLEFEVRKSKEREQERLRREQTFQYLDWLHGIDSNEDTSSYRSTECMSLPLPSSIDLCPSSINEEKYFICKQNIRDRNADIKLCDFKRCITFPEDAEFLIQKLHSLIDSQISPKYIFMPLRAAVDAGVIRRPTWKEFCLEFGETKVKSKNSHTTYLNNDYKYTDEAFNLLVKEFSDYRNRS